MTTRVLKKGKRYEEGGKKGREVEKNELKMYGFFFKSKIKKVIKLTDEYKREKRFFWKKIRESDKENKNTFSQDKKKKI